MQSVCDIIWAPTTNIRTFNEFYIFSKSLKLECQTKQEQGFPSILRDFIWIKHSFTCTQS